jgi:hypothetical protein
MTLAQPTVRGVTRSAPASPQTKSTATLRGCSYSVMNPASGQVTVLTREDFITCVSIQSFELCCSAAFLCQIAQIVCAGQSAAFLLQSLPMLRLAGFAARGIRDHNASSRCCEDSVGGKGAGLRKQQPWGLGYD